MATDDVDLLRRAAARLRELSMAAHGGRWTTSPEHTIEGGIPIMTIASAKSGFEADHIAAWDPAVALAVADWLESIAWWVESGGDDNWDVYGKAFALARTFLREDQPTANRPAGGA